MAELNINNYPQVRQESCVMHHKCGNCLKACRDKAVIAVPYYEDARIESKKVAHIDSESCSMCGLCYQVCPTGAIYDANAKDYRTRALDAAGKGRVIIFACEHTDFNSSFLTLHSSLISVPDISIVSWRDIFKVMSMGSPVMMVGCEDCRQTGHFRQMKGMFAGSCYEGAFRFVDRSVVADLSAVLDLSPQDLSGDAPNKLRNYIDENTFEQIITSYTNRISFPGTAWVDVGERCTLCQNCAKVCPTGAFSVNIKDGKTALLYNHSLCNGCPICEKACPEKCITIDRRLRPDSLFMKDVKCKQALLVCRGCSKPIGTDAVLERVRKILIAKGQSPEYLEYCPDCKSMSISGIGSGIRNTRLEENYQVQM